MVILDWTSPLSISISHFTMLAVAHFMLDQEAHRLNSALGEFFYLTEAHIYEIMYCYWYDIITSLFLE